MRPGTFPEHHRVSALSAAALALSVSDSDNTPGLEAVSLVIQMKNARLLEVNNLSKSPRNL